MNNQISYLELLKETVDITRDTRPYDRGSLRPQIVRLVRRELASNIPDSLSSLCDSQIEFIFATIVLIEQNICTDLIRQLSKFWTDNFEDSVRLKIKLEQSLESGCLSKLIDKDSRDRLKVKSEFVSQLMDALIPASKISEVIAEQPTSGTRNS